MPEPLSEEKLAELEEAVKRQSAATRDRVARSALPSLLAEVRQARAILTPEVLRLIEAGREVRRATTERHHGEPNDRRLFQAELDADTALTNAALALPFEKPAESNHTEKQQLPKKGGE